MRVWCKRDMRFSSPIVLSSEIQLSPASLDPCLRSVDGGSLTHRQYHCLEVVLESDLGKLSLPKEHQPLWKSCFDGFFPTFLEIPLLDAFLFELIAFFQPFSQWCF